MENKPKEPFHSYFFIESHPTSLGKDFILKLSKKNNKAAQPLTKVLEKEFKLADGKQDFLISVYSGKINGASLKPKEITINEDKIKVLPVTLSFKIKKTKFKTKINPYIDYDCFIPFVKFNPMKKLLGKSIDPPPQINLTPFNYISLFSEALTISLKKPLNEPTVLEFLRFCVFTIKTYQKIPFKLFLLIYDIILFSQNLELISSILELFSVNKIEEPKSQEIIMYKEKMMMLFKNQNQFLDNIKNIQNISFFTNLSKYYYIIIYYFYILNDTKSVENIITDLRDKNSYDKLIVAKLFLNDVSDFCRKIPISNEIKLSLIDGYLQASETYQNLLTAFSLIKEYIKGDMNQMLEILIHNYDKIHQICFQNSDVLKLDDYISPKIYDKVDKIQESLTILGEKKLSYGYKAISIKIKTWNVYLKHVENPTFFEFLSSFLIQVSLKYSDIKEVLDYLIFYTKKDVVKMLQLFVKNYDKLESICQNEDKHIDASNYLETSTKDNPDAIKENFDFILSKKLSSNYETITFPIKIWISYINFSFNNEFLLYIENKLLDDASSYENIIDCLTYATCLRKYKFVDILKFIIENFEKINNFAQLNAQHIDFSKFYKINKKDDDMESIYQLICQLIPLEINKNFRTFDFSIKIWEPYSDSKDLKYLRTIRKIIKKLYEMDSTLDEDSIKLPKKIHEVGYLYIKQGKLNDDELIEFIGIEESFYTNKVYDGFMDIEKGQIKQLNDQLNQLNNLDNEYNIITGRGEFCGQELQKIIAENNSFVTKINSLQNALSDLMRRVNSCENDTQTLKFRFQNNI